MKSMRYTGVLDFPNMSDEDTVRAIHALEVLKMVAVEHEMKRGRVGKPRPDLKSDGLSPTEQKVYDAMKGRGWMRVMDVVEASGVPRTSVGPALTRMRRTNIVTRRRAPDPSCGDPNPPKVNQYKLKEGA